MAWVLFLLVVAGLACYFATPDERARFFRVCWRLARQAGFEAWRRLTRQPDARGQVPPPVAYVTCAIVLLNLCVFARMLFGAGAFADPQTLLRWGGSFGPRTTNGEWWRLVTAAFVHAGWLHLFAMLAGLIQIGAITERIVGRVTFGCVYLASGILASLVCLFIAPTRVAAGSAGAILGIYGLLAATCAWGLLRGNRVHIAWPMLKRALPGVGVFLLYNAASLRLDRRAGVAALAAGLIIGLVLARGTRGHRPALRRVAVVTAATAILAVLLAVPLWGMADVRPAIDRVILTEDRTATAYEAALARFNNGSIPAIALSQMIDVHVVPDLDAARAGVSALKRVPREHRMVVALAEEYLRLREECWRLRSDGLRRLDIHTLQDAQRREWQALELFKKVRELVPGP